MSTNTTGAVTLVNYAKTDNHVASIHRSGCRDIAKDSRKHNSRSYDIHSFATVEDALVNWIDEGLAELDYTRADVRVFPCTKGGE
jgi:hypothetical protein